MRIGRRTTVVGCLLALLLGAAACDTGAAAPPVAGSTAPSGAGRFGGTDLAWVEINIAMNEELLPLLELVATHSSSAETKALAAEVAALNDQELSALRGLHDQAGLPAENPHKGMPMPGMVTPELVTQAAAVRGATFDRLLAAHLKAHFEQGVRLAESEAKAGVEPETKALATRVISGRERHLPRLAAIRRAL
ncbi:DUF305 domain-containing protein [Actinoplanes sp. NPDC049118]|uniref:DUF305 domain-containing protein n=1 Tax=Actinoplanes sp. NPDC049118 TaxID=3155769 RepID=UPI0033D54B4F